MKFKDKIDKLYESYTDGSWAYELIVAIEKLHKAGKILKPFAKLNDGRNLDAQKITDLYALIKQEEKLLLATIEEWGC